MQGGSWRALQATPKPACCGTQALPAIYLLECWGPFQGTSNYWSSSPSHHFRSLSWCPRGLFRSRLCPPTSVPGALRTLTWGCSVNWGPTLVSSLAGDPARPRGSNGLPLHPDCSGSSGPDPGSPPPWPGPALCLLQWVKAAGGCQKARRCKKPPPSRWAWPSWARARPGTCFSHSVPSEGDAVACQARRSSTSLAGQVSGAPDKAKG